MRKIESQIINEFESMKNGYYNQDIKTIQLSNRDTLKSYRNNDNNDYINTVTYYLWENPIITYYEDNNKIEIALSFCGWLSSTTLSRLRAFESIFNFTITNISTGCYRVKFLSGDYIDINDSNSNITITYSLIENKIINKF